MADSLMTPGFWVSFYIIHALLVSIACSLILRKVKRSEQGTVVVISLLALIIPVAGELFGAIAYVASRRLDVSHILDEYEELLSIRFKNYEPLRFEAKMNADLRPLSDVIANGEPEERKKMILRHINTNIQNQGKYLQMGLENQDSETVHYAAATMNQLLDQYEHQLKEAKNEATEWELEALRRLSSVYKNYLGSSLLTEVIHDHKVKEWRNLLKKALDRYPDEAWIYAHLSEAYELAGNHKDSIKIMEAGIRQFPGDPAGYVRLVRHHYTQSNWGQLKRIYTRMQERFSLEEIPREYRFAFEQMRGDENWKKR